MTTTSCGWYTSTRYRRAPPTTPGAAFIQKCSKKHTLRYQRVHSEHQLGSGGGPFPLGVKGWWEVKGGCWQHSLKEKKMPEALRCFCGIVFSVVYNLTNETSWNSELLQENVGNNPAASHGRHLTRNCVRATAKTLKFSVSVCFPRCPRAAFTGTGYQIISYSLNFTAMLFTTFKKNNNFCFQRKGSLTVLFHLWHLFLHRRDWVVPRLPNWHLWISGVWLEIKAIYNLAADRWAYSNTASDASSSPDEVLCTFISL